MKQSEINQASSAELQEKLAETRQAYSDLKMAHTISPLENPIQLRAHRKTIARIATELTNREEQ
ncbi:MAG: 50S ribosomal protein L29 [Bacteroidia bacterium]|nr:50S ribosomal protein L29 [Bacteroidia bacterium]MBT8274891.1 50S ribosomal protein L29 [Bacteroidia bacterium]NNJ81000.1 50S ribosomal protein L29 [Flavobacteriaceae bacterium]NNK53421.1 50S ribosomal protein L29 [Flavobacteriaceae bacterium]NNM09800.1 50S ribosomal protein L29 [Flavobacteriaceae bacterium]